MAAGEASTRGSGGQPSPSGQIDMLQAEVTALKTLVITSTPASPNRELHPQLLSPTKAGPRKGHLRHKSTSSTLCPAVCPAAGHILTPDKEGKEVRSSRWTVDTEKGDSPAVSQAFGPAGNQTCPALPPHTCCVTWSPSHSLWASVFSDHEGWTGSLSCEMFGSQPPGIQDGGPILAPPSSRWHLCT